MRRTARFALFLALSGLFACNPSTGGGLEGVHWKVVEAERAGKPNPPELGAVLSFAAGKLEILSPQGRTVEFEYVLDPNQSPAHVDLTRGEGDRRFTMKGIWKIEDDRFTLCLAPPFDDRPTEYATAEGNMISLTVHERVAR